MTEFNSISAVQEDDEIDLAELFFVLRRKIWE